MVSPTDRSLDDVRRKNSENSKVNKSNKPYTRPKADTFKTMMNQKDEKDDTLGDVAKKKKGLFDLDDTLEDVNTLASPLALFQQQAKAKPLPDVGMESTLSEVEAQQQITKNKPDQNSDFAQSQHSDLSWVNPNVASFQTSQIDPTTNPEKANIASTTNLQEIIDQMVEKIYVLTSQGKTDTTVEIKYPPLFEGALLTISSYSTARGEFNISLSNLSPAAKQVLDMQQSQNNLKRALEDKGYTLHILVTTTEPEIKLSTQETEESAGQQHSRNSQDEEQQQKRQKG